MTHQRKQTIRSLLCTVLFLAIMFGMVWALS